MKNYIEESKRIIQNSSKNNKLIVFVGAGISANSGVPMWKNIIDKIKTKTDISNEENDYLKIAQYYYNSRDKKEYYEFLESELNIDSKPNEIHDKLLELNPYHIITTNYDELIEQQANKKGMFYDVVSKDSDLPYTPNNKMIIKMHGDFKNRNIVFKEDDYLSYSQNFKLIETYIKSLLSTHTILFVGYSLSDPDIQYIFQWVKDILGNDLPKPYFLKIDKENEFDINEYQYYKNKGINILYYSKLDEELRKKLEENSKEINNSIGKKTLGFIKYLLDDYKMDFQIKFLYDFIDEFEKINYIDNKVIVNFFYQKLGLKNISDFEIKENTLIFYNNKADDFIEQIKNTIRLKTYDYSKIIKFLDKVGIKFVIKQNKDEIKCKIKIIYRNRQEYRFLKIEEALEKLDYLRLKDFITNIDDSEVRNNYKLSMEKAYAMYYIEEYYDSYKEYKKISENALKNKEFAIYAISEFNRYYVGKIVKNYYYHEKMISERVEKEIQKIELDKILLQFPLKSEEQKFLKSILNWNFVDSKIHEMINIKQKIDKDENTCYTWIDKDSIGIYQFQNHIKKFWQFIKYNMLAIDRYSEVKGVFYNYIDGIVKNYTVPKIYHNKEESIFGEASENVKIEELTLFDLTIMLEYISTKELENIFQRYEIKTIKIKQEDVEQFIIVVKNCINFIRNKNRYYANIDINKIFLILTVVELNNEQYKDINKCIIEYANNNRLWINEYKYINKYIYYQNERFNNFELNTLVDILYKVIESIEKSEHIYNEQINIINNIAYYIRKNNRDYKLKNITGKLIEKLNNDMYSVLINLYSILDANDKRTVNKLINTKLNEGEFSKIHCEVYYEALMRKIIKPKIKYENKYFDLMKKKKDEKEKTNIIRSYPDTLEELLGKTTNLILNNYIIEKEKFGNFLGIKDDYDFLYNINGFPANRFNVKWLYNYSESLIKGISENKKLKVEIKRQIEKIILEEGKINNKLLIMYVKYFS